VGCPECGARSGHLFGCSKVDPAFLVPAAPAEVFAPEVPDERRRLVAFPLVFVGAWLLVSTELGAFIGRTFFGMWLHELGHASAAWLCGRFAVPLPWVTITFGRSWLFTLVLVVGLTLLFRQGRAWQRVWMQALAVSLGAISVWGHLSSEAHQELFFTFAGEAGAMVFGAALASAYLLPATVKALQHGLRTGWLVIGAIAWADATHLWVQARRDPANLPFGLENGIESDATRLVDRFHWAEDVMISRYLLLGALCLLAALAALAWRLRQLKPAGT
jgi:hypothetical protein